MNSSTTLDPALISVVIPVIDDAEYLDRLCQRLRELPHILEIIVGDGGSTDRLREIVDRYHLTLVTSSRGRGLQMNRGAQEAMGEILWFLHADTLPDKRATVEILRALENRGTVGGAFRFSLSEKRWYGPFFEWLIGLRSSVLLLPYGDQGFFIRTEPFRSVGGFPEIPIMEDVEILSRIKTRGSFRQINIPIGISPRRWDREGVMKRTLLNWWLMIRYKLGAAPRDLAKYYAQEHRESGRKTD